MKELIEEIKVHVKNISILNYLLIFLEKKKKIIQKDEKEVI